VIVVDTNVLAYLLIPGRFTERAEHWLQADPRWAAPRLWRSELGNVLATYVRAGSLPLADAVTLHRRAGLIIGPDEYEVEMSDVLRLSSGSGCSAYDCEFVALADFLDVPLLTADARLRQAFPGRTTPLAGP
jgi:predicted nucleic acid-binding protein